MSSTAADGKGLPVVSIDVLIKVTTASIPKYIAIIIRKSCITKPPKNQITSQSSGSPINTGSR